MEGKGEQVKKLEDAASKVDEVILASDPDREGEAIAWHVEHILKNSRKLAKKEKLEFKRIAFHSITKEAVLEALEHPRGVDMNLVDAQQARRFLDRLVGYKLSPILWKKVRRGCRPEESRVWPCALLWNVRGKSKSSRLLSTGR